MAKHLRAAGAVENGRLVIVPGNRGDAGNVDHRREPDPFPYVDQCDRHQGKAGIGKPARPLYSNKLQRLVDDAGRGVHHHRKGYAHSDRRDQHREEDDGAQIAAADNVRSQQHRQQQTEDDLEPRRDAAVDERVDHSLYEEWLLEELPEIVEADVVDVGEGPPGE